MYCNTRYVRVLRCPDYVASVDSANMRAEREQQEPTTERSREEGYGKITEGLRQYL